MYQEAEKHKNETVLDEAAELNRKKEKEIHERIAKQLEKNMGYLNEMGKLKVKQTVKQYDANITAPKKIDELKVNNSTVDFEVPRRYRNAKCKPIIKKIYKKKAEPKRKVVKIDVLEEKSKQLRAKKLIRIADNFIQNTNDDE